MIVHLVRHGETVSSKRSYAGRLDVELTDIGRAQADMVADRLAGRGIGAILTSPLLRSIESARPLANRLDVDPIVEPSLMEIDFGDFEGRPKIHIGLRLRKSHLSQPIPGGESLWNVWQRAEHVTKRIIEAGEDTEGDVVVVGHHWINRMIFGHLNQMAFQDACASREYRPRTGSILEIDLRS